MDDIPVFAFHKGHFLVYRFLEPHPEHRLPCSSGFHCISYSQAIVDRTNSFPELHDPRGIFWIHSRLYIGAVFIRNIHCWCTTNVHLGAIFVVTALRCVHDRVLILNIDDNYLNCDLIIKYFNAIK